MICPKCEEGTLKKIQFKTARNIAYLCDVCDALWFADEHIDVTTGHTLRSYTEGKDLEYPFEELDEKDQDHQPVTQTKERSTL